MTTTLDGYQPQVGDTVWMQMYSPQIPSHDATITERVANGSRYCERRIVIVRDIFPGYDITEHARSFGVDVAPRHVTRWVLQDADPKKRGDACKGYSWVEDDWCVLELVTPADDGRLF